jgi:hypothetical protein
MPSSGCAPVDVVLTTCRTAGQTPLDENVTQQEMDLFTWVRLSQGLAVKQVKWTRTSTLAARSTPLTLRTPSVKTQPAITSTRMKKEVYGKAQATKIRVDG